MNNLEKKFRNEEGKEEMMVASSDDNYNVNLSGKYVVANRTKDKESALVKKFKGSILGADIGVKSKGFGSIAGLAVVIALAAIAVLYFLWRF